MTKSALDFMQHNDSFEMRRYTEAQKQIFALALMVFFVGFGLALFSEGAEFLVGKYNKMKKRMNFVQSVKNATKRILNVVNPNPTSNKTSNKNAAISLRSGSTKASSNDGYTMNTNSPLTKKYRSKGKSVKEEKTVRVRDSISLRNQIQSIEKHDNATTKNASKIKPEPSSSNASSSSTITASLRKNKTSNEVRVNQGKSAEIKKIKEKISSHLNLLTSIDLKADDADIALIRSCAFIFNMYHLFVTFQDLNPASKMLRNARNQFVHSITELTLNDDTLTSTQKILCENHLAFKRPNTNFYDFNSANKVLRGASLLKNISDEPVYDYSNPEIINWLVGVAIPFFNYLEEASKNASFTPRHVRESLYLMVLIMGEFADKESRENLKKDASSSVVSFLNETRLVRNTLAHKVNTPKKEDMTSLLTSAKNINPTAIRVSNINEIFRPSSVKTINSERIESSTKDMDISSSSKLFM